MKSERIRNLGLPVALLVASAIVLGVVNWHYPIRSWLLVRYARYWAGSLLLSGAILVAGDALLAWIWPRPFRLLERIALAFPLGLVAYFWLTFLFGLAGLLGVVHFIGAPVLLALGGLWASRRRLARLARHLPRVATLPGFRPTPLSAFVHGSGFFALALVYFSILSPENTGYDARWYHLPIVEQYVADGSIFRFEEGWVMGTYPQLTSLLYLWAFEAPGTKLFDHVEFAAHLEFFTLLWRLFSIPALAAALLPKAERRMGRMHESWVVLFAFPGIFLYDSSLALGADHVAALFAAPAFLVLIRVLRELPVRGMVLLSAMLAGALLTKYTTLSIVAPVVLIVVLRAAYLLLRSKDRKRVTLAVLGCAATGLALTAPHWLKNWVWYGDPMYPQLHNHLALHPWTEAAALPFHLDIYFPAHATRDLEGVLEALGVMFTFAFVHHDWADLHGKFPVFGFLFTMTALCLPFIPRARRLWLLYAAGHFAVFVWAMLTWLDRYLQILLPWLAAGAAAVLFVAFRRGLAARLLAVLLVVVQVAWGSDVFFFTTHRVIRSPHEASLRLINTGREKNWEKRYEAFEWNAVVDRELPPDARPLIHESRQTFGMGRRRVFDRPGTTGLIYYDQSESPRQLATLLSGLGVTHLVYGAPESISPLGADLVFYDFVHESDTSPKRLGPYQSVKLRTTGKYAERGYRDRPVLVAACTAIYAPGLYHLGDLTITPFDRAARYPAPREALTAENADRLVEAAEYLVREPKCPNAVPLPRRMPAFEMLTGRGPMQLFVRTARD